MASACSSCPETRARRRGGYFQTGDRVPILPLPRVARGTGKPDVLGELALDSMPHISQVFVARDGLDTEGLERALYVLRKAFEKARTADGFSNG